MHRLYRDGENGIIAGVCAGIAEYFGLAPYMVRLAFVVSLVFFFVPAAVAYVVLALALPQRPAALSSEEEQFWRAAATEPQGTLASLRRKFGDLETRLRDMESQVTSRDFELRRKFRDLGG